jgi:hypothetical protein
MKTQDILYKVKMNGKIYNFIDGRKWICVERYHDSFVFINIYDKRILNVKNARPCYIYKEAKKK